MDKLYRSLYSLVLRENRMLVRILSVIALVLSICSLVSPAAAAEDAGAVSPENLAFYENDVKPILATHCWSCHGAKEEIEGELRLTGRNAILQGGESGPAVSLTRPEKSLLLAAINYQDLEMPPKAKLPKEQIAILTRWVKLGVPAPPGEAAPDAHGPKVSLAEQARSWWAYQPLGRSEVPQVKNRDWVSNPIDAFVLAKLEANNLSPNTPASKAALIRRVTFDLTGLPPTPEEVSRFVSDESPQAYEQLVDRLLESKHYGEHWGRHWLDLVRYAESHGYERDSTKPFAWRYRDYVIRSFNQDKPYSQFIREQLAGDELDTVTAESLTATGYYRLGVWDDEPADREQALYDSFDDIVSTTGQVFLGMTVGCARCHNHKADPIPQADYYRLLAFFRNVSYMNRENTRTFMDDSAQADWAVRQAEKDTHEAKLYHQIFALRQQFKQALAKEHPEAPIRSGDESDLVELQYRFYRDTWEQLPEFDDLRPEASGPLPENFITLEPASRREAIGLVYEGKLHVPADGRYTFSIESTDGFRLRIANKVVAERAKRGKHRVSVTTPLKAGLAPLRLDYFHHQGEPNLSLAWSQENQPPRPLSTGAIAGEEQSLAPDSRKAGHVWRYTFTKPADNWATPNFQESDWKEGPGGFGTKGTPGSVVRTNWTTKDIWLRTEFTLADAARALAIDLHHDEDVEIYLNGQPIYEAKKYTVGYHRHPLPDAAKALQTGRNVLAVHCRQTGGGQYIDVGLVATARGPSLNDLLQKHGEELLGAEQFATYQSLQAEFEKSRKVQIKPVDSLSIMAVAEQGRATTHILLRGSAHALGDEVQPGFPRAISADYNFESPAPSPNIPDRKATSGRRRVLADWLVSDENQITPRVMMNRLWQHHFGRGICPTPNDFGRLGEQPTHPELLDYLAVEFRQGAWRLKRMHKLILMSSAYRMSSSDQPEGLAADPANRLFWRFNMRRLTAEEIRDAILSVSGNFNPKMAGPSIYPVIPQEVLAGQSRPGNGWGNSSPEERSRRSVYIFIKRSLVPPELSHFDFPDTDSSCAARFTTTVPTQSLNLLNSQFLHQQAETMAARLRKEAGESLPAQVRRGLSLACSRAPTNKEVAWGVELVEDLKQKENATPEQALKYFCLLALNLNEFMFVD